MLSYFLRGTRAQLMFRAGVMIAVVALFDWRIEGNVFFGFLYLFPMLMLGTCLPRWQLALVAASCTVLAEWLGPGHWLPGAGVPRDIFIFTAYFGTGLFAYESGRNRHLTLQHIREMEQEVELRRDAEQQLKVLIESSPAAILMMDSAGRILMANHAAHGLLGFEPETLTGWSIRTFLPPLARIPQAERSAPSFRTAMQCNGRRRDGEVFLADVWFSSYHTRSGPRLAAMLVDVSEDLRDREEFSLQQLIAGSRLVVGAVSHEIRNLCSAIAVVYANLSRSPGIAQNEDFKALANLVEGLGRVATLELRQSAGAQDLARVDLYSLLDELRIVIEPPLRESGVLVRWELPEGLPAVWADRHNLLQVLLNLIKNSQRAVEEQERKEISISALLQGERVVVRVRDTGPGVAAPERLFQPFQRGSEASGLGLYISRAFAKAFDAELRHEPEPAGCCFALDLSACGREDPQEASEPNGQDQDSVGGRSHALSGSAKPLA
ncbi:MAG TPA: ATP-binding protein [Terriglobia bacterium]|jgi:two-component system sensor kinase FixL|nr:ATP-binding protein [Terriglobia bacterium]